MITNLEKTLGNRQYIASATVNSTVYILAILVQVILCNPGSDSDLDHHCISGNVTLPVTAQTGSLPPRLLK